MQLTLELLTSWSRELDGKTDDLNLEIFKSIIHKYRKAKTQEEYKNHVFYDGSNICDIAIKICEKLFDHFEEGFVNTEAQILCATSLCCLINILPQNYHDKFASIVHETLHDYIYPEEELRPDPSQQLYKIILEKKSIISLVNGLFKSDLICNEYYSVDPTIKKLSIIGIRKSLQVVVKSCMVYSYNAFVSFKNLQLILESLLKWKIEEDVISDLQESILFVIFHNWENPYPGVRETNIKVLWNYLRFVKDSYLQVLQMTLAMPWNRAKFYTLRDLIPDIHDNGKLTKEFYDLCIQGLRYSLKNNSLISAGKELYKMILETLHTFSFWGRYFFSVFIEILRDDDHSEKMNILKHWLTPTIEKFPEVIEALLEELEILMDETSLYSILFILKVARKTGNMLNSWSNPEEQIWIDLITKGLTYINVDVRAQAFEVVCCSSKINKMPHPEEFKIVRNFLLENVIEDDAVFRQSVLNSFTLFLIRMRDSFLHISRINLLDNDISANLTKLLKPFKDFFVWFYNFLFSNLIKNGNYQRKILSLKLFDLILRYFSINTTNTRENTLRKSNQRDQGWKIKDYIKRQNIWSFDKQNVIDTLIFCIHDPTNDVRESATNILIQYYGDNAILLSKKNYIFINAITLCNSRMFYEVESGALLLTLLFHLPGELDHNIIPILKGETDNDNKSVLEHLVERAWQHFVYHSKDLFYSICNNQPLYGLLLAINMYLKSPKKCTDTAVVLDIIKLVISITQLYLKMIALGSAADGTCPSFAEMGQSIDVIISSSDYKCGSNLGDPLVSDAHQLVLNNIWLNFKSCSELASTIIESCYTHLNDIEIRQCLEVNVSILMKCRHKGAIESAGINLGKAVKFISSVENRSHRDVLASTLGRFLGLVTSDDISGSSITRKSAGLPILVHRFVTNDVQDSKPLFSTFIISLLNYLSSELVRRKKITQRNVPFHLAPNPINYFLAQNDNDPITDMPQARALHLLGHSISDSSFTHYVLQFTTTLSTYCFEYFTSDQWQVRNAALQLYGTVIPKIVGQKGKESNEIHPEAPVTADELFSHDNALWNLMCNILKIDGENCSTQQTFYLHAHAVPVLSALSHTAKRSSIKFMNNPYTFVPQIDELFPYLIKFLSSPIYTVRNSAAKVIELFYDIGVFKKYCIQNEIIRNENMMHGRLLVLKHHLQYYKAMKKYTEERYNINFISDFRSALEITGNYIQNFKTSFLLNTLYLEILYDLHPRHSENCRTIVTKIFDTLEIINRNNKCIIGSYQWINMNLKNVFENCEESSLIDILNISISNSDLNIIMEGLFPALKNRIQVRSPSNSAIINKMMTTILNIPHEGNATLIKLVYEVVYKLLEHPPVNVMINYEQVFKEKLEMYYRIYDTCDCGYLIPFISTVASRHSMLSRISDSLEDNMKIIQTLKKLLESKCDEEKKLMIAIALNTQASLISHLCKYKRPNDDRLFEMKTNVVSSIFWLLQDEDADVRYECANISFFSQNSTTLPNSQVKNMLTRKFLYELFDKKNNLIIKFLRILSEQIPDDCLSTPPIITNPFDHHVKNIYLEPMIIKEKITFAMAKFS